MLSILRNIGSYAISTARGAAENVGQLVTNKTEKVAAKLITTGLLIIGVGVAINGIGLVNMMLHNSPESQAALPNTLIAVGIGMIPLISGSALADAHERSQQGALQNRMHRASPFPTVSNVPALAAPAA